MTTFSNWFIEYQFSLRAHLRRSSSFLFQSIQLTLAELVCSASHQNWTKFWLALPIVAWGLVFVFSECDLGLVLRKSILIFSLLKIKIYFLRISSLKIRVYISFPIAQYVTQPSTNQPSTNHHPTTNHRAPLEPKTDVFHILQRTAGTRQSILGSDSMTQSDCSLCALWLLCAPRDSVDCSCECLEGPSIFLESFIHPRVLIFVCGEGEVVGVMAWLVPLLCFLSLFSPSFCSLVMSPWTVPLAAWRVHAYS